MAECIRVLSIDDSKAVHAFVDRSLAGPGFKVVHAMDGESGLKILREINDELDIVLLDWEMPGLTGPEVLRKIRSEYPNLPVVMLTSKSETEDIATMLENGASEYVMKPFTPDILIEKIQVVLGL